MEPHFLTKNRYIKSKVKDLFKGSFLGLETENSPIDDMKLIKALKKDGVATAALYKGGGFNCSVKTLNYPYKHFSYELLHNEAQMLRMVNSTSARLKGSLKIKFPIFKSLTQTKHHVALVRQYVPGRTLQKFSTADKITYLKLVLDELSRLTSFISPQERAVLPRRGFWEIFLVFPRYFISIVARNLKNILQLTRFALLFYRLSITSILTRKSYVLAHRDLNPENIIVGRGGVNLIDLDNMVLAEKETDVAITARYYSKQMPNNKLFALLNSALRSPAEKRNFLRLTIFYTFQEMLRPRDDKHYQDALTYLDYLDKNIIPHFYSNQLPGYTSAPTTKIKVTVAIAAYNAQNNIRHLISALLAQVQDNYILEKIIVFSDSSSDRTVELARKYSGDRVAVIDSDQRGGFAKAVQKILGMSDSEFVVVLNDDIKIYDQRFISKYTRRFLQDQKIGLITGNPQPLPPENFVERVAYSGFKIYENLRYKNNDGNNILSCDGKTLGFSKKFIDRLNFPSESRLMGNVDSFLYYSCLSAGLKYGHARDAIVYYRLPSTVADYVKWMIRNNSDRGLLEEQFGKVVNIEDRISKNWFVYFIMKEFFIHPLRVISLIVLGIYIRIMNLISRQKFSPFWDVVSSTKRI